MNDHVKSCVANHCFPLVMSGSLKSAWYKETSFMQQLVLLRRYFNYFLQLVGLPDWANIPGLCPEYFLFFCDSIPTFSVSITDLNLWLIQLWFVSISYKDRLLFNLP